MKKYQCPCCGNYTYNVPANEDCGYICPVCFWENDPFIVSDSDPSDSNHGITLKKAKSNYLEFGICDKEILCRVPPLNIGKERGKERGKQYMGWKNIKIQGIGGIQKCVGEFDITETIKTPYSKFKIKIYEEQSGKYVGYTNLLLKDDDGCALQGVGYGETVEEALKDTIEYFLDMINQKKDISDEDYECADPFDF